MKRHLLTATLTCAALALIGCGRSTPSQLYVLYSPELKAGTAVDKSIALDPVRIPKHLDRLVVMTQHSNTEMAFSETQRWAGPLANNITSVLKENLSKLLANPNVYEARFGRKAADITVSISLQQFSGELGEEAYLKAHWTLTQGDTEKSGISEKRTELDDRGESVYVEAQSKLLVMVAEDVAAAIRTLAKESK